MLKTINHYMVICGVHLCTIMYRPLLLVTTHVALSGHTNMHYYTLYSTLYTVV